MRDPVDAAYQTRARRSYGTGSLTIRRGKWFGQWRVGGRTVSRVLGTVREPGTPNGLTRSQAERELRRRIESDVLPRVPNERRLDVRAAGERYLHHLEHVMERKRSTVRDYELILHQLAQFFGERDLDRIEPDDVVGYMASKRQAGAKKKTISNHVTFLHGIYRHAVRRRWATTNPVAAVDRPTASQANPDIRFLELEEVAALIRATPSDDFGATDRALYLTAAMTGLRQGELIALRWRDVDFAASRLRVRRNRVRGEYGTPKSRRSSRSVPLADRVAAELDRHSKRSAYQRDDDLVFPHPHTGNPLDPSNMLKRFYAAMKSAGMEARCGQTNGITFHSLRHTFGTRMAAAGVPLRTLQEWMGHSDYKTTQIYADYAPDERRERDLVERAFAGDAEARGSTPDPRELGQTSET